jgi:hypothetical protein
MWNGFDVAFIAIFFTYFGLRVKGLFTQDGAKSFLRKIDRLTSKSQTGSLSWLSTLWLVALASYFRGMFAPS